MASVRYTSLDVTQINIQNSPSFQLRPRRYR